MITKLRGIVDSLSDTFVVLDVGGVGYQVYCSSRSLGRLPALGEPVTLFTELIIREEAHILLGFYASEEREWYRLLTSVQGVGMRVALSLLSLGDPTDFTQAIFSQDKAFIARAEGVGPKLAARIVNELKDKVACLNFSSAPAKAVSFQPSPKTSLAQDAISALMNLGYRHAEAAEAIEIAGRECGEDAMIEQLIRSGLARLARL